MSTHQSDVLIVGAGPAGLASAIQLKKLGVPRVIVVDREPEPGGMPRLCHHTGFGVWDFHRLYTGPQYARRYVSLARAAGVDIRTETTVTGWLNEHTLLTTSPQGIQSFEARSILLATGVRERPRAARLVPGYRPRGVFTTGSLQRFVDEHHLPVGRRAVIVGAEGVSLSAFMTLTGAGVEVAAMLTHLPRHQLYFPYSPVKWWLMDLVHRTPILTSTRITRILGRYRVEGVEIARGEDGQVQVIPCDTVVFTGDWVPEYEVARWGDLAMDPGSKGPGVDGAYRTSRAGIFAAGNVLRGAETAATSAREGRQAAGPILDFLQGQDWPRQIPIQVQSPIDWVFPNRIAASDVSSPPRRYTFRVKTFASDVAVEVRQGRKLLHQQRFRHLLPNETMRLDGAWARRIDLGGEPPEIRVTG